MPDNLPVSQDGARSKKRLRLLRSLYGLVLAGLLIQLSGVLLTDRNWEPVIKPNAVLKSIGMSGLVITVLAPVFSIFGLILVRKQAARLSSPAMRMFAWAGAIVFFVLSLGEFLWSCSGHPTWFMAFA